MPTAALITAGLEASINRLLKLASNRDARLAPLVDKVFALELTDVKQELYFLFHDDGVDVLGIFEGTPDARISGTVRALVNLGASAKKPGAVLGSGVQFSGDVAAAQAFQNCFQNLDIDWEEQLSRYTGDIAAHQLGNLGRSALGFFRRGAETIRLNLKESLQEELRLLPTRDEVEEFTVAVEDLQSDLARLEARLRRLGG